MAVLLWSMNMIWSLYALCVMVMGVAGLYAAYRYICIQPGRQPRKSAFTDAKQRALTYPPTYPNGWYHLASVDDVKCGQAIQVEALGRKFAVFRTTSGEIGVLDAFCPHGGANLACGTVAGENLVCPFHLWEFKSDGAVANVPWLKEPPKHIRAKSWTHQLFHGMVCIWFDAEGREPLYDLPRLTHLEDGSMRFCDDWEVDRPVYMHLIEYMENTVDIQHFTPMHGEMAIPWTTWRIPGITVLFDSQVVLGNDAKAAQHCEAPGPEYLFFLNTSSLQFCGKDIPRTTASVAVQFIGPASLNRFPSPSPIWARLSCFRRICLSSKTKGLLSVFGSGGTPPSAYPMRWPHTSLGNGSPTGGMTSWSGKRKSAELAPVS